MNKGPTATHFGPKKNPAKLSDIHRTPNSRGMASPGKRTKDLCKVS